MDITDQKRTADALAIVNRRKNEFLAMLAHELRNPLVPIRNAAHLLRGIDSREPGVEQAHDTIDRQIRHMVRMIDDLLDIARVEQGKIRLQKDRIDLVLLVRNVISDARDLLMKQGLSLEVELPDRPLFVMGDLTRLSQVVGNLLDNASKFTESGGHVRVALWAPPDQKHAILAVEDSGIGMDTETLPSVFEIFGQADRSLHRTRGGIGLGLSLVRGLIVQHGGTVRAESEGIGRGSRFIIELPLEPNRVEAQPPAHAALPATMTNRGRRVLVIEDSEDAALTMKLILERSGHRVELEREGRNALEAARRFAPEVVLCDIGLPGELDGYAVARAMRADPQLHSTYLIALTGYGTDEDKTLALRAGFDVHMTKPLAVEDLMRAIANASTLD